MRFGENVRSIINKMNAPSAIRISGSVRLRRPAIDLRLVGYLSILAFACFNLLYLLITPFDLAPDEAHYWDWSRHLDWGYYSKGPVVAWLIALSCEWFGTHPLSIRLPAVACNTLMLIALFELAIRVFRSVRMALLSLLTIMIMPALAAGAILMTIDAPFLCCWSWALLFVHRAIFNQEFRSWIFAGVIIAIGILTKYTMAAFPILTALYLVLGAVPQVQGYRKGLIWMVVVGSLGWVPIILWNVQHDWLSFRHLFGQAGLATGPKIGFKWNGPLDYLGGQFALLAGYWFCAFAAAAWQNRQTRNVNRSFLWWFSVPLILVLIPISLRVKVQPNWPAAAYLTGFLLAVHWIGTQLKSESVRYRKLVQALLILGIAVSIILSTFTRFPGLLLPVFNRMVPEPSADRLAPVRNLDPTARLRGWKFLAEKVDEIRESVRNENGEDPLIATMTWSVPGELGFYCAGRPSVYTFGPALNDRLSQYDIWRPNPISDAQVFKTRTFVYVGEKIPEHLGAFERCDGPIRVEYRENGVTVGGWKIWIARGFRGFASTRSRGHQF